MTYKLYRGDCCDAITLETKKVKTHAELADALNGHIIPFSCAGM